MWRARFQQRRDVVVKKLSSLQGKAPKKIHSILTETLGEHSPSYATVTNWVAQFKSVDFLTCYVLRPGRLKRVTKPDIIDSIHGLIFEDHRVSAKSIAEQLGISRDTGWVHHSWRFEHEVVPREVGPEVPERGSKTSTVPVVWATFGIFRLALFKLFPVGRD